MLLRKKWFSLKKQSLGFDTKKIYCYIHVLFSHRMPLQLLCRWAKCIIFYFFSILKLQYYFCHICVILLLLSEINCVYVYGDSEILLVMIRLGVTGLKKTRFVYLLNLFRGEGGRMGGVIFCVGASLDYWANGGFADAFFMHGMILVLWGVGVILGNGYRSREQNYIALLQGSEMSAGFHPRN